MKALEFGWDSGPTPHRQPLTSILTGKTAISWPTYELDLRDAVELGMGDVADWVLSQIVVDA
jgi:hypothetical protein